MNSGELGKYHDSLISSLKNDNAEKTFDFFVNQLEAIPSKNFPLSSVFLILSELDGISKEVSDFSTDLMLYCEDELYLRFNSKKEVEKLYQECIRPLPIKGL